MKKRSKYKTSTIKNTKFIDSETLYERFVDPNSKLVKIHDGVDFSFVNDMCDGIYSDDGQHAYLPELPFRATFIQFFKGGISDNEVVKQCRTNLEYRYFCNLAIDEDLFDDCKLSRFRKDLGPKKFKEIFDMIVEKIKAAGLIDEDDVQYMDSFLLLADVKLVSINALISKAIKQALAVLGRKDSKVEEDAKKRDFELSEDEQKKRFVFLVQKAQDILASAKHRNLSPEAVKALALLRRIVKERVEINGDEIRKKESGEEKDKIISVSDQDARMMGKKEHDVAPSYKAHVAMNKNGFITYAGATIATVYDGHHAFTIVRDLKSRGFRVPATVWRYALWRYGF